MKKIYLILQSFPPAAFALKNYWYAYELQQAGFEVIVITARLPVSGFEDPDYDEFRASYEIVRLPGLRRSALGKLVSLAGLSASREAGWEAAVARYLGSRLRCEPGIVLATYPSVGSQGSDTPGGC